ncbi:cytochrome c maturation protein CcmE [Sphingomonas sp. LY29]|uniref:cytochrome c maturation protein CcmE n=1 Tax=Sphingomonas sp. LY29 TaxID=3095341 RepID=UPI002D782AEE|nr:cytochrome c maturation protein CcmE [Sphingomonas sp. LY29]WRP26185.1 cytochrome c maturation protein CcmE [Sphingomonas sp. LY29]
MTIRPKHQRLILLSLALVALMGAVLLAMWGLQDRAAYFVTPVDIAAGKAGDGRAVRLGGMVVNGSLRRNADGVTVDFIVGDGKATTPVRFRGITPDLFREGSGVVAEGRMEGDLFVADTILAKHDERYMPPQMEPMTGNMTANVQ